MGVLLLRREGPRLPKRGLTCTLASLLPSRRQVPLPAEDSAPCLSKLQGVPGPLEDVEPTWLSRNPSLGGGERAKEDSLAAGGKDRARASALGPLCCFHLPRSPTGSCKPSLTQATSALGLLLSCKGCDSNSPQTWPGIWNHQPYQNSQESVLCRTRVPVFPLLLLLSSLSHQLLTQSLSTKCHPGAMQGAGRPWRIRGRRGWGASCLPSTLPRA